MNLDFSSKFLLLLNLEYNMLKYHAISIVLLAYDVICIVQMENKLAEFVMQ